MEIREYLREIGKRGGSSKSQAKRDAAAETLARVRAKRWPVKTGFVSAWDAAKAHYNRKIIDMYPAGEDPFDSDLFENLPRGKQTEIVRAYVNR